MIDLLLVRSNDKKAVYDRVTPYTACEPPYWLAIIASYIRNAGFSVEALDAEAENLSPETTAEIIHEKRPSLVGLIVTGSHLSASTQKMQGAGMVATALKNKCEIPIFMWGLHPSALPEKTAQEESVDYVVKGENLPEIKQLLEAVREHNSTRLLSIQGLYLHDGAHAVKTTADLMSTEQFPLPAWDLLPMECYRPHDWQTMGNSENTHNRYGVIATSLGCPFSCEFCAISSQFGCKKVRYFSSEQVLQQIDVLVNQYKVNYIKILDENFILNRKHVNEICDLLARRNYNLSLWAYARIDTVTPEILKKCKEAHIDWLAYGIESPNELILADVSKGQYGQSDIENVIKMTQEAGCNVMANFMFGLPDDTIESMQETLEFAKKINPEYINFYCVMAYPGSALYQKILLNHPEYLPKQWIGYSQYAYECQPLPTKYISAEAVLAFRDYAYTAFFENNNAYFKKISEKFGDEVVQKIKQKNRTRLKRKLLEEK